MFNILLHVSKHIGVYFIQSDTVVIYTIMILIVHLLVVVSGVPRGGLGCSPPPEIPEALQNRAKLNLILKTVKKS